VLVLVFICIVGSYLVRLKTSGNQRIKRSEVLLGGSERWGGAGEHICVHPILRSGANYAIKGGKVSMSGYRNASS